LLSCNCLSVKAITFYPDTIKDAFVHNYKKTDNAILSLHLLGGSYSYFKAFLSQKRKFSPEPCALILYNPVVSTMPDGYGYERLQDMAWALSPSHHVVDADLPPTLIFHVKNDKTVPIENILDFQESMNRAKVLAMK